MSLILAIVMFGANWQLPSYQNLEFRKISIVPFLRFALCQINWITNIKLTDNSGQMRRSLLDMTVTANTWVGFLTLLNF